MPALVSCCFVWVSQTVAMTTTSSYCTDVICDIILKGKRKARKDIIKNKTNGARSQRTTPLGLLESQAAATLSSPKPKQHSTLGKTCPGLQYELRICSYMKEILSPLLIWEL